MAHDQVSKQFRGTAPYFVVQDVVKSVEYYHKVLGFDSPKLWGQPPTFAMPARDGFAFMLKQAEAGTTIVPNRDQDGYWDAYVWVNDVDALFSELSANGAIVDYEPHIQADYNMKEFAVKDLDGYVIAFGQHYEAG